MGRQIPFNALPYVPFPGHGATPLVDYVDVSELDPAGQQEALSLILQRADMSHPAPFTGTPPWNEATAPDDAVSEVVMDSHFLPPPDTTGVGDRADVMLNERIEGAFSEYVEAPTWDNDDQYFGLGVPPGVPNYGQAFETGISQNVPHVPSTEYGTFFWAGDRPARVARHENAYTGYARDTYRKLGNNPVEKFTQPYVNMTQQYRDMLFQALRAKGVHNIVVANVPSVPFTEQVQTIDPSALAPEYPIGEEGIV